MTGKEVPPVFKRMNPRVQFDLWEVVVHKAVADGLQVNQAARQEHDSQRGLRAKAPSPETQGRFGPNYRSGGCSCIHCGALVLRGMKPRGQLLDLRARARVTWGMA